MMGSFGIWNLVSDAVMEGGGLGMMMSGWFIFFPAISTVLQAHMLPRYLDEKQPVSVTFRDLDGGDIYFGSGSQVI